MDERYKHITFHDNVTQGSPEWLEIRSKMLSGTDSVKVRSGSTKAEILEKKSVISDYSNDSMDRGHILEDTAIDIYQEVHKVKVGRSGYITNEKYKDCMHSPDGFVISSPRTLLEVKAFDEGRHRENMKLVEPKIIDQIAWGMMIGEFEKAVLLLINPELEEDRYFEVPFDIDSDVIQERIKIFKDFLNRNGEASDLSVELKQEMSEIARIEQEIDKIKDRLAKSDTSDLFMRYLELSEMVNNRTKQFTNELKRVMFENNINRMENDVLTASLTVRTQMKAGDIEVIPKHLLKPSLDAKKALSEYYQTGIIPAGVEMQKIAKLTLKKKH